MSKREALARAAYEAWAAAKAAQVSWFNPFPWDELTEDEHFVSGAQECWLAVADALLAELREPDEGMLGGKIAKLEPISQWTAESGGSLPAGGVATIYDAAKLQEQEWLERRLRDWQAMIDRIE